MIETAPSKLSWRMRVQNACARLKRDSDGVAAVEFAYIAPILLVMLMATFELSRAVSIDRRLNSVSAMASELVAREEAVDDQDLMNIYASLNHVMKPYDDNSLVVRLLQVRTDNNGATKVEWSTEINATVISANGGTGGGALTAPYSRCAAYPIDANLQQNGTRVVIAEVGYNYRPVFGDFVFRDFSFADLKKKRNDVSGLDGTWSSKAFHSPRWNCVAYDADNCLPCP